MPDTNNREFGSKEENERHRNVHAVDEASIRARQEKERERVEEDRSSNRTRNVGAEQFTAPGGEGQQYKPSSRENTKE
jgi:hypothetical protein